MKNMKNDIIYQKFVLVNYVNLNLLIFNLFTKDNIILKMTNLYAH